MIVDKLIYLVNGWVLRPGSRRECPACRSRISQRVDQKWSYELRCCGACALLYRYPYESSSSMKEFYQMDYKQSGLATDLPSSDDLARLVSANFVGSELDYSAEIRQIHALGLGPGARVLDYGANWGYGVFQFGKSGFDSIGYEISKPRAAYADNLGVIVHTQQDEIVGPFDVVHSRHVLEHVPDPRASLQTQWDWVRPGGYLIATTPNGSNERRQADEEGFHKHWGQVHPVLLTDEFVQRMFSQDTYFLASEISEDDTAQWDQRQTVIAPHTNSNLQFIIRKQGA